MKRTSRLTALGAALFLSLIAHKATAAPVQPSKEPAATAQPQALTIQSPATERLKGRWRVDFSKTVDFAAKNLKTTPFFQELFACSLNDTTLTFSSDVMALAVASHVCQHKSKRGTIEGFTSTMPYSVVFDSERQTALVLIGEREREVRVVHWTAADQFWVDDTSDSEISRYFFKKEQPK